MTIFRIGMYVYAEGVSGKEIILKTKFQHIRPYILAWKQLLKYQLLLLHSLWISCIGSNNATQKESVGSVHLTDFPVVDENKIDYSLVEKTHLAQQITSMVFSLRKRKISKYASLYRK